MSVKPAQSNALLFWLVCIIYFFTGLTALGYEVLWARILSTLFGVSIFGVVVTISAFLAGLGVGSIVGTRFLKLIQSPLRLFAVLEILVALFAFNLSTILTALDVSLSSFSAENYSQWLFVQAVATFGLMFIPAFALGVGFPLILATLKNSKINVGTIYALNTLGGVVGALLPLVLLPLAGWTVSVRLLAIFAIFMGLCAFAISFMLPKKLRAASIVTHQPLPKPGYSVLLIYACVGAGAIMLQIAWARLYGMILLRTEYVMAIILATFLVGIGLGSLLAARVKNVKWLVLLPMLVCVSGFLSLYTLPLMSEWVEAIEYISISQAMLIQGGLVALLTLPATLAFGAWFPMLVSVFGEKETSSSSLYGFNAVGAALGGLLAGFVILPSLGTAPLILISMALILFVSLYWIKQSYYKVMVLAMLVLGIPVLQLPTIEKLLPATHQDAKNLFFFEDAMSLTHVVEKASGERILLADLQRMDASTDPTAVRVQKNQARLPLLLHPKPEKVLFLGLGTGITAAGSLAIENLERTSVELSKGSIWAAENYFQRVNGDIGQTMKIIRDDARRFLKAGDEKFDIIVGDLFHPDLIGRSELLSLQQFERAKNRLAVDGVFVQWLALNQFDLETLKVVLATFQQVFPDAVLFMDGFRLGMLGVNGEFYGIEAINSQLKSLSPALAGELTGGEGLWSWAARYWGPIRNVENAQIQDEWAPVIEFQLPKAKFNRQNHLHVLLDFLLVNRDSITQAKEIMRVTDGQAPYFEQARMASEMYYQSWMAAFSGKDSDSQQLLTMAYANNPDDQWVSFGLADGMFVSLDQAMSQGIEKKAALLRILEVRPDHIEALKALRLLYLAQGEKSEADRISSDIMSLSPLEIF